MTKQEQIKKLKKAEDDIFDIINVIKSDKARGKLVRILDLLEDVEMELSTSFEKEK